MESTMNDKDFHEWAEALEKGDTNMSYEMWVFTRKYYIIEVEYDN